MKTERENDCTRAMMLGCALLTYKLGLRESSDEDFARDIAELATLTGEPRERIAEQYRRGSELRVSAPPSDA